METEWGESGETQESKRIEEDCQSVLTEQYLSHEWETSDEICEENNRLDSGVKDVSKESNPNIQVCIYNIL